MKRNIPLILTKILYVLFAIGTIISLIIVYKNIDGSFTLRFLIVYMFFTFFMLLYIPFITILNSRKLKWVNIRKKLLKFIVLFISFGVSNYVFDYVFRPSNIDLFRRFSIAFGVAFGVTFADVTLLKKNQD